jgi:hypothetical protein
MRHRLRSLALFVFPAFFLIQFAQIFGPVAPRLRIWPFCPYDMFAFPTDYNVIYHRIVLTEADGTQQVVDPGNVLPVEFFRANVLFALLFGSGSDRRMQRWYGVGRDENLKRTICQAALRRLNSDPWRAFDETFAAARPRSRGAAARFVAMTVVLDHYDFARYDPDRPLTPARRETLFTVTP